MASLVHNRSAECVKSELDLFSVPPTQTSFEKSSWQEYPPTTALTTSGPIEFHVSGSGNDYIDLMHTMLYLRVRIVNGATGDILPIDTLVAPVNLLLHSLFSQVEVNLNGRTIGHANALYPYRAIIETLLNYSSDAANGHLQSELFYKDTAGFLDVSNASLENVDQHVLGFNVDPTADDDGNITIGNDGLHKRWLFTRGSQACELMGPLHIDICQQEKLLPNNVDVNIKLTRSKSEFYLMTRMPPIGGYKIVIDDVSLFVRKVTVTDHVFLAQQQALMVSNAVFPISYVCLKSFTISQGSMQGPSDNIFLGQLPVSMVIVFVDTAAMNGHYIANPFNFKHMNVSDLVVRYNGVMVPAKPFHFMFDNNINGGGQFARAFQNLFLGTGKMFMDKSSIIQRQDFSRGYALFCFDFRADVGCRGHYALKQTGAVQVDVRFAQALPNTINMIVYAEFESFFEITGSRDIVSVV